MILVKMFGGFELRTQIKKKPIEIPWPRESGVPPLSEVSNEKI
jgi:hypothetical protein